MTYHYIIEITASEPWDLRERAAVVLGIERVLTRHLKGVFVTSKADTAETQPA